MAERGAETKALLPKAATYETFDKSLVRHPQDAASCWSRSFLSWVTPLMEVGQTKQLSSDDLWPLQPGFHADVVAEKFGRAFAQSNSMAKAFFACFGVQFVLTGLAMLISMLCTLLGPVVLRFVVSRLAEIDPNADGERDTGIAEDALMAVGLLVVAQIIQALTSIYGSFGSEAIAIKLTASVKTLMFQKTLRLSAGARKEKSTGEITNLYTADCDAILNVAYMAHQVWLIPLQITIVSAMLYEVLDVAAFAGIAVIVAMLYANNWLSKFMFGFQRIYRKSKDVRMKKVTEVFKAIGIVKFNAWEERFLAQIQELRKIEIRDLFKRRIFVSISLFLLWGMPVFISIASFGVYAGALKRELTPSIVFTSIALFQLIQGPMRLVTNILSMLVQSKVAFERISAFLEMSELNPDNVDTRTTENDSVKVVGLLQSDVMVDVRDGSFSWDDDTVDDDSATCVLQNINLRVNAGDFYVVHGSVGCGKSSLCSAILGEMTKRSGSVFVGGSIAYCSQQPWIQNMTLRDNILFGKPFDQNKFDKVIDACALRTDLELLPAGEYTEIGERGVNLSGGQMARVALARACYTDADIYLLDAPLAAVDAMVQNEIFHKCLLGLLRHKTIILITHNPEIISSPLITHAVTIEAVEDGLVETHRMEQPIEYEPLVSPLSRRVMMFSDEHVVGSVGKIEDGLQAERNTTDSNDDAEDEIDEAGIALASPCGALETRMSRSSKRSIDEKVEGKLVEEEVRVDGHVGGHVFRAYYNAAGGWIVATVFFATSVFWQLCMIAGDFWLGEWSNDSNADPSNPPPSASYRLTIYSVLGLTGAAMILIRMLMAAVFGLSAARKLFDAMTLSLLHAPMRFFDENPIGRILTRYGSDVSVVDANIPPMFARTSATVCLVGCSAITAALVIRWQGLLLLPVVYIYYRIAVFYLRPARELQRLGKTTQAPVLNHLSESIDGASVVRAFGPRQIARFVETHHERLNDNNQVWFSQLCVSQWFALRIQLVGTLLVAVVTVSLVLLRHALGAAVVGLAFSYALKVSQGLKQLVEVLAMVEPLMVSPERMREYTDIEQEAPSRRATDSNVLAATSTHWPSAGSIEFRNVSFRYRPQASLVLHDVSFSVPGGHKIGIVGRTGAGKSSLTMALFRINELAGGTISIDGVDISKLGLTTLRERLSIIPQHPVLFKGTLRSYLDPFDEFSDEELWRSVDQVGLRERVSSDELKLLLLVEENGENFSVGERQMLCMARALLRNSRVVVFDEATAAIDHETDQKLQGVIRSAFKESTVLTIAHRLDTILDSDRVLVLDGGKVVAFASPRELVDRGEGHFFELMREAGLLDSIAD